MSQEAEKIEALSCQNRALVDQVKRLEASNKELTRQLLDRNETVVILEQECRRLKAAKRKR